MRVKVAVTWLANRLDRPLCCGGATDSPRHLKSVSSVITLRIAGLWKAIESR